MRLYIAGGEDIGDCRYGNLTNNILKCLYNQSALLWQFTAEYSNYLLFSYYKIHTPFIQVNMLFSFQNRVVLWIASVWQKTHSVWFYILCLLNKEAEWQAIISVAIRDIKKDKFYQFFFQSQRDASLPLWNTIEREMQAETCISKMRRQTYKRCQGQSFCLCVWNDRHHWISRHHPTSLIPVWYNMEAGEWEAASCHSSIGLDFCCLMPTAFSYGNVWLSSWRMVKYFAKLSS